MNWILIKENLREALFSLYTNRLRATLTILMIAFGITALVGVLTSIDGIRYWLRKTFTTMGSNTFSVTNQVFTVRIGGRSKIKYYPPIEYREAEALKEKLQHIGLNASIRADVTFGATVKYRENKTTPNITLAAVDDHFQEVERATLVMGRYFTRADLDNRKRYVIIGAAVAEQLFGNQNPLNRFITIGREQFQVIGVLRKRGTAFGGWGDKICLIPLTTAKAFYSSQIKTYKINVFVPKTEQLPFWVQETIGIFRVIRGLRPLKENNFAISLSEAFVDEVMRSLRLLTMAAIVISVLTLVGAGIGLMNILLVSVAERTREIGIRKAIGASQNAIRLQFFTESIVIGQVGALLGILFGSAVGNLMSIWLESEFLIPWKWMLIGSFLCLLVSLLAGYYPANEAAKKDPIDCLRYE